MIPGFPAPLFFDTTGVKIRQQAWQLFANLLRNATSFLWRKPATIRTACIHTEGWQEGQVTLQKYR